MEIILGVISITIAFSAIIIGIIAIAIILNDFYS
jgi:hypothetical protein